MSDRRSTWVLVGLGSLCLLAGIVWTLQGAGILLGSFMTGSRFWLSIGILLDVAGVYLIYRGVAGQPRAE
jgi:hypothetical protein